MTLGKANMAGLSSPQQRSEMKCILAGTWPPLKPLPVFKYETPAYRASIDFDKLRGEWVCRKTSFPSNKVQELRGELRAITLTLPHGETEPLGEAAEEQDQELEKDANRRIQALREWKENYEDGAAYFELRSHLSESQRNEADDSLRFSLTARQLQFTAKNIARVFEALSTAGGRFATLMELAKRNKLRPEIAPTAQAAQKAAIEPEIQVEPEVPGEPEVQGEQEAPTEEALPDAESALSGDRRDEEIPEGGTDTDELPAVSITNVFPEPYQDQHLSASAVRASDAPDEPMELETPEMAGADSPSLIEPFHQRAHDSPAFPGLPAPPHAALPADPSSDFSSRLPAFNISAFLAGVASLFLFVAIAFAVGLMLGRNPLKSLLQEPPKSTPAFDAESAPSPAKARDTTPQVSAPPAANADGPASSAIGEPASPEAKPNETPSSPAPAYLPAARSANSAPGADSAPTSESKPPANPVVSSAPAAAPATTPGSLAAIPPAGPIIAAAHLPGSAMLVPFTGHGRQPFRVSFPARTIAARHSLAMSSQLSVLVSPDPARAAAHAPARLEGGQLLSFVWPSYPGLRSRTGTPLILRIRAAIGPLGQVQDVKFLSGSLSLFPPTAQAIRQWQYAPTLLDQRPVQSQQDLTIEFYPPKSPPPARHRIQKLARSND